jgi:hypothetical protein
VAVRTANRAVIETFTVAEDSSGHITESWHLAH